MKSQYEMFLLTFPEVEGGVALLGRVEVALGLPRLGEQEAAILLLVHETAERKRTAVTLCCFGPVS